MPASHLLLTDEAATPTIGSARGIEDRVLGEVGPDRVEVVLVERHEHPAKHLLEIRGHLHPPRIFHRVDLDVRVMALILMPMMNPLRSWMRRALWVALHAEGAVDQASARRRP
jgi:hypothetical protein